jgi:membrane-associated protease RseP (regulator of RpoE activity)
MVTRHYLVDFLVLLVLALAPAMALVQMPLSASAQGDRDAVAQPLGESTTEKRSEKSTNSALLEEVGLELAAVDGGVRVERIVKNSPAAVAHLEEKDLIRKVAGENVLTPDRVSEVLDKVLSQGESKTEVVILRDGEELSYLLSLESITPDAPVRSSRTTVRVSQAELVEMIQQLQRESQEQRRLLESVLAEVQSLRAQWGGTPASRFGQAPAVGAQYTGDIVAPLGQGSGPAPAATSPGNPNSPP